jgi:D-xylose transport system permease protein
VSGNRRVIGCGVVLVAVWVANSYPWPVALAEQYAQEHGIPVPADGLNIPTGIAIPVVIMIVVALVMSYIATRRRFGRYVYAIGGNPDAAELGGIRPPDDRGAFVLMGV